MPACSRLDVATLHEPHTCPARALTPLAPSIPLVDACFDVDSIFRELSFPSHSSPAGDGDGFWFNPTDAPQTSKNLTPLEAAHHFFVKGYQPEFHVANATLLGVEAALFTSPHIGPSPPALVSRTHCARVLLHVSRQGVSRRNRFRDVFRRLGYTGFIKVG